MGRLMPRGPEKTERLGFVCRVAVTKLAHAGEVP